MRLTTAFTLAPALLAAAQSTITTTGPQGSTTTYPQRHPTTESFATTTRETNTVLTSATSSDGCGSYCTSATWYGGQMTLILSDHSIVGTVFGPHALASTLNNNPGLATKVEYVAPTVYTTTATPSYTTTNPLVHTRTVGGGPVTLIVSDNNIVGTVYGPHALALTLNQNNGLATLVSSVPLATITTTDSLPVATGNTQENAAPTKAAMLAGGLVGAAGLAVGLL